MNENEQKQSKEWIDKALLDYKEKINTEKNHGLDLSSYKVTKPWGHEIWLELNEFYAYKLIHMKAGHQSSLQMHEMKIEANYVIDGEDEVLLEDDRDWKVTNTKEWKQFMRKMWVIKKLD